ncbi:hypothetical protein Ab1vBOLIVR2_gp07 [Agrobacterium phage OLIVR2]|uniref:Uncharacterized protein n=1 Tax=Agrobacterium phage OLIVR1 TaxID=2723769 RepID=A0A858MQY1_9CAUD|nr:hypothetical protein KNU98_gp102 [Agrobacterium phage OLIVR1]QIW87202.1 hypothetical protein Ab1vBOLIVR1_gp07 [Agrobacterium phage OLIVR1]QIW87310.1 hypothetical protein Ab1vBOLIVR2_gp07 [Agrobacterium phage OLIVR2]QIW87417.1 hypothetical protein Ab1vBOLIVR3_gp07 [Agrobacterium phage OLIVR3]
MTGIPLGLGSGPYTQPRSRSLTVIRILRSPA